MTYHDEARARAKRRKSAWNLLLIPAILVAWFLLTWLSWVGLGTLYRSLHPGRAFVILPEGVAGIVMAVGPLLAWIAPAMIMGNLLVAAVAPARRALDEEARSVPGSDLSSANRSLLKMSLVVTPASLLVSVLAAFVE